MKYWFPLALAILSLLCVSLALAEDFKTIKGKEYKNATVTRVEPDGIIVRTAGGMAKIYFVELPKDVADKWLAPIRAAEEAAEQKRIEAEKAANEEQTERKGKAEADLKRATEQFQAAEQRASQAYQSATKGTLSGQVFVSTAGGENFKLGAVEVGLFTRDAIEAFLPALKRYADFKIVETGVTGIYRSGSFYFYYLQNPIQTAETDVDGKFVIEVPRAGKFVITAQAERRVGSGIEHYYWMQPVSLNDQKQLSQNLSNHNLTSTTGTSALVLTDD